MRLFILLFLFPSLLFSQTGYPVSSPEGPIEKLLSTSEIKKRRIRRIYAEVAVKNENDRIRKTGKQFIFEYDVQGLPVWSAELPSSLSTDTVLTLWYRNKDSTMLVRRKYERGQFSTSYIRYDSLRRPCRFIQCTETSEGESPRYFKPLNQYIQSLETVKYEVPVEGQLKKKFINDNGLVYKEGIAYTRNGKLFSEEYFFSATGMRVRINYRYDDEGQLIERQYYTDAVGEYIETLEMKYENGKLTGERFFRNTLPMVERFFFYRKEDGLPESILTRNTGTYILDFFNLRYEFYID
jgi:hypothetical protein